MRPPTPGRSTELLTRHRPSARAGAGLALSDKVLDNSEMEARQGKSPPRSMHQHAERELRAIRSAMTRAGSFTALPGWGGIGMGLIGLAAATQAARVSGAERWLETWLLAAALAVPLGAFTLWREARDARVDLRRGPARRFVVNLAPPLLMGAVLSAAIWRAGPLSLLPAVWLLGYGLAVLAAGAFSLRLLAVMGSLLMLLGAAAAFAPLTVGNLLLGVGFGLVQVIFGAILLIRAAKGGDDV